MSGVRIALHVDSANIEILFVPLELDPKVPILFAFEYAIDTPNQIFSIGCHDNCGTLALKRLQSNIVVPFQGIDNRMKSRKNGGKLCPSSLHVRTASAGWNVRSIEMFCTQNNSSEPAKMIAESGAVCVEVEVVCVTPRGGSVRFLGRPPGLGVLA